MSPLLFRILAKAIALMDLSLASSIKIRIQSAKILLLSSKCEIIFVTLSQYWTFLYCSPFSYTSPNFAIAKVVTLNLFASIFMSFVDWLMASFLYCFPYSYRSSNYCDSNSCRSFTLLKALAKSNGNLFAIAFKSEKERQLSLSR